MKLYRVIDKTGQAHYVYVGMSTTALTVVPDAVTVEQVTESVIITPGNVRYA